MDKTMKADVAGALGLGLVLEDVPRSAPRCPLTAGQQVGGAVAELGEPAAHVEADRRSRGSVSRRSSMSGAVKIGAGLLAGLALGLTAARAVADPQTGPSPLQALGEQGVAQRNCGTCHAVAPGADRSPLADAPPFAALYQRYPAGGLDQLLTEGMLAPSRPPEEGSPSRHPRMPMVQLDDDEIAQLRAYLRRLDPRPQPRDGQQ